MAHDTDIQAKLDRFDTILDQLEAGYLSVAEAEQLHNEGHQLLDEMRTLLTQGEGNVIEREG